MAEQAYAEIVQHFSAGLADIVARVAPSVVRVDDGSRLTATGIVWTADGVIVATSHGVERDEELFVERAGGERLPATLVGRDSDTDLAVLRVQAADLPAIPRADGADAKVGSLVLALGSPGASGVQATLGLINARTESETNGQPGYILQTDAVLYPGFSGGPLVDASGRVVGITNRMFGRGVGVAVGTPVVAQVVETLLKHGTVRRGYLGIRTQLVPLPENLRQSLNLQQERGLLVVQVETGSPADTAGLLLGDTLLAINGQAVQDVEELRRHLIAGSALTLRILRGGEPRDINATLVNAS